MRNFTEYLDLNECLINEGFFSSLFKKIGKALGITDSDTTNATKKLGSNAGNGFDVSLTGAAQSKTDKVKEDAKVFTLAANKSPEEYVKTVVGKFKEYDKDKWKDIDEPGQQFYIGTGYTVLELGKAKNAKPAIKFATEHLENFKKMWPKVYEKVPNLIQKVQQGAAKDSKNGEALETTNVAKVNGVVQNDTKQLGVSSENITNAINAYFKPQKTTECLLEGLDEKKIKDLFSVKNDSKGLRVAALTKILTGIECLKKEFNSDYKTILELITNVTSNENVVNALAGKK